MSAVTTMSGIDEVELRRHLARGIGELLDDLADRQDIERCDNDRPCCHRTPSLSALRQARSLLDQLTRVRETIAQAIGDDNAAGLSALGRHAQLATSLGQALDAITDDAQLGCSHVCPSISRNPGDAVQIAWELLDTLEGHGYQFGRTSQRWAS
jgi:hypothetical protein